MSQLWKNLPEKFLIKLDTMIPEKNRKEVLESFCHAKPITIRINTLKSSITKVTQELQKNNVSSILVYWTPDALIIPNATTRQLTDLEIYKQGHFYLQSLSSMIPVLVLNPQHDETILDLCAAPGSKTTQIAARMQNTGTIIANDRSRQRLFKLQANLKQQGVLNTKIMSKPGEILWKWYPSYFDKVLVDVPCSMEGRFVASEPQSYHDWSNKKVKLLAQSQKWLLRSAVTMTKPGGTIVYSTCTLSPEENEEVISWLLKNEPHPLKVEAITIPNLSTYPALPNWNNLIFPDQLKNTIRVLPSDIMEAFFVAKIKKI